MPINKRPEVSDIQFAVTMEAAIRKQLEGMLASSSEDLAPLIKLLTDFQSKLELLLDKVQNTDEQDAEYPDIDIQDMVNEAEWRKAAEVYSGKTHQALTDLTQAWMVYSLIERTTQYYWQAAAYSPYPTRRIFFHSLSELKHMIRRKTEAVLRVMHNNVWAGVGFPPFDLGINK